MRRTTGLLTFSACALGASAFLIPPGVALASENAATADLAINAKSFALQVPCSECVFSPKKDDIKDEAEDEVFWIQGGANAVVLNFTVSEDGERLALNGEDIYPLLSNSLAKTYVDQVPATSTWADIKSGNARTTPLELTASGITIESAEEITPQGDVMVAIKHTIFELEHQPVSVDAVSLKVLQTSAGELLIAHVETVERMPPRPNDAFGPQSPEEIESILPSFEEIMDEFEHSPFPPPPHHHKGPPGPPKECNILPSALCKLRNALDAKLHGMKAGMGMGCHGRKGKGHPSHMGQLPGHIRPHFMRPERDGETPPPRHHGRPHHMRPHGHHHHEHHEHSFMHSFSNGFTAVLIPTFAGIAVGMTVSLVGLLVGRLISFLWIKLYRGGRRGYASVALDVNIIESEITKDIVLEKDVEAPPAYEQSPEYVEVVNEQK